MPAPDPVTIREAQDRAKELVARRAVRPLALVGLAAPVDRYDLAAVMADALVGAGGTLLEVEGYVLHWQIGRRHLSVSRYVTRADDGTRHRQLLAGFDVAILAGWLAPSLTAARLDDLRRIADRWRDHCRADDWRELGLAPFAAPARTDDETAARAAAARSIDADLARWVDDLVDEAAGAHGGQLALFA